MEIGGLIKKFNLSDWWQVEISNNERAYLSSQITFGGKHVLDSGDISNFEKLPIKSFFNNLLSFTQQDNKSELICKIVDVENKRITSEIYFLNKRDQFRHYSDRCQLLYRAKDHDPSIRLIEYFAAEALAISKEALSQMLQYDPPYISPHPGFNILAQIYKRLKRYSEAIELFKKAIEIGWPGDWQKEIERINKKTALR